LTELQRPNERTTTLGCNQTPTTGSWFVGYFALWIGLLLVMAVLMAFAVPVMAILLLLQAFLGEVGIGVGAVIVAPAWIWLCFRFFFPTLLQIIWIDGRPAIFALSSATPRRVIGVVTAQLAILRSDLRSFSNRIGRWLNA
jgi:hypothetical protein